MESTTPLDQTRTLMVSQMPEYRPLALREVLRAATLKGGGSAQTSSKTVAKHNELGMPAWLDIFLYCVTAFVVGVAIFIGLYGHLVQPYKSPSKKKMPLNYKLSLSQPTSSDVGNPTPPHDVFVPHPPPPPPL